MTWWTRAKIACVISSSDIMNSKWKFLHATMLGRHWKSQGLLHKHISLLITSSYSSHALTAPPSLNGRKLNILLKNLSNFAVLVRVCLCVEFLQEGSATNRTTTSLFPEPIILETIISVIFHLCGQPWTVEIHYINPGLGLLWCAPGLEGWQAAMKADD